MDIEDCSYSRCGRTDKGVSGFHQVVALYVRSDVPKDAIIENGKLLNEHWPDDAINIRLHGQVKQITEVDYVARLNKQLPMDIRVSGWCPVSASFDARFSALYRTYRYYFVRKSLDLEVLVDSRCRYNLMLYDVENETRSCIIRRFARFSQLLQNEH